MSRQNLHVVAAPLPTATRGVEHVAAKLREAIIEGHYTPGARLPPEREIANHFSTSRGSVRGALARLEAMGLVERRLRSGTFVTEAAPPVEAIAERTSPLELISVRMALEPAAAQLATTNASARDLVRVGEALDHLEAASRDRERFSTADEAFHLRVVECTRNPLMISLYHQINEVRGHAQWAQMKDEILTPVRIAAYNDQHRRLFEALERRDGASAAGILSAHLEGARSDLVGASSLMTP